MEGIETGKQAAQLLVEQITKDCLFEEVDKWEKDVTGEMESLKQLGLIESFVVNGFTADIDGKRSANVIFKPIESPKFIILEVEVERKGVTFKYVEDTL